MVVFGIHSNFLLVLPIRLKPCRSNGALFFTRQNVRARKIGGVSEVLRARESSTGIGHGHAICPGLEHLKISHHSAKFGG